MKTSVLKNWSVEDELSAYKKQEMTRLLENYYRSYSSRKIGVPKWEIKGIKYSTQFQVFKKASRNDQVSKSKYTQHNEEKKAPSKVHHHEILELQGELPSRTKQKSPGKQDLKQFQERKLGPIQEPKH